MPEVRVSKRTYDRLRQLMDALGKSSVEEVVEWLCDVAYDVLIA